MTTPPEPKLRGNLIADTSIRQPIFVLMLMLLAIVIGGLAYTSLPVNLIPDIDIPTVSVVIPYPGAGPESGVRFFCAARKIAHKRSASTMLPQAESGAPWV